MKIARLTRVATLPGEGTFGVLSLDGQPFCVTLEPYHHQVIPAWSYLARPYDSPTFGDVYLLRDVTGRTYIELHPGNRDDHTKGCILLGEKYGKLRGDLAVLNSGATFRRFLQYMDGDPLLLTIVDAF